MSGQGKIVIRRDSLQYRLLVVLVGEHKILPTNRCDLWTDLGFPPLFVGLIVLLLVLAYVNPFLAVEVFLALVATVIAVAVLYITARALFACQLPLIRRNADRCCVTLQRIYSATCVPVEYV